MTSLDIVNERNWEAVVDEVRASDKPEVEKVAQIFAYLTQGIIEQAEREIELARAMHDQDEVVKQQIKMETVKFVRQMFEDCYSRVTGRRSKLWHE
jgi:hypothetical protein